ncbi:MAG: hypothetical protein HC820_06620, partial [Hydrococcus sp. RM1_1_31]|nr:hypothetical protein [Hydrococcus sp. RM1_1_31]
QQQTLPLFGAAAKLQAYAYRRGEPTQSTQTLLEGKGVYYSLDGEKIPVPEAILKLLAQYECSAVEAERIVQLYGVLQPKDLLTIIEQIPLMRQSEEAFPDFIERVKVSQPSMQTQQVSVSIANR